MTCPEEPIVAFLVGELSEEEERRFDEHLLSCESCWHAIQADRAGRLVLEQLREPAPPGLQGRVSLAVMLANNEVSYRRALGRRVLNRKHIVLARTHLRLIAATCLLVVVGAGVLSWFVADNGSASNPPQVAAVVAMMTPGSAPPVALRSGEHLLLGDQQVLVRAYMFHGVEAIVATSATPFPVPSSSHQLSGSSPKAWMATRGSLSMYGVNRTDGGQSMFVVAAMPMAELPGFAARLHLI